MKLAEFRHGNGQTKCYINLEKIIEAKPISDGTQFELLMEGGHKVKVGAGQFLEYLEHLEEGRILDGFSDVMNELAASDEEKFQIYYREELEREREIRQKHYKTVVF